MSANIETKERVKMDDGDSRMTEKMDDEDLKTIHQFLLNHNFESTAGILMVEAGKKGFKDFDRDSNALDENSADSCVNEIISSFKEGDWKTFFKFWNFIIPECIKNTKEYKILTLNLHVHFAVLPKRTMLLYWAKERNETEPDGRAPSMIYLNRSFHEYKKPENFITEIEKNMDQSMEQLQEYLNTIGKELEQDTQLRPFFALPFIEDPHAEPFLSKIFQESWLDELTENLQLFINRYKRNGPEKKLNQMCLINKFSSANTVQKNNDQHNIPIVPNDRNIPAYLEDGEVVEEYTMYSDVKCIQKSNRSIQAYINNKELSSNLSGEHIRAQNSAKNEERLIQSIQELALTKSQLCAIHSNYEKLKLRFHKLHEDYHKLISIAGELTSALENSVKGQSVDLQATLETCIQVFPDLFNQNIRHNSQFSSTLRLYKSDMDSKLIEPAFLDVVPISPKFLDYKKIKLHLINGSVKAKLFLLQALRRKITLSQPGERDEAVHEYISSDLLGLHGHIASDNGKSILPYLLASGNIILPHPLQQSTARLLNVLASFRCGRDYLSFGSTVVNVIIKCLVNTCINDIDTLTLNMIIAMLQKLSLRKQQRIYMIENGLVEWLVHHLQDQYHLMDSYRLEYTLALLMNLSLHRVAQIKASTIAPLLISTLMGLLSIDNISALLYVNGALYNFLSNDVINDEAKKLKLSSILEHYRQHTTGEIRKHLDYILKRHRREISVSAEDEDNVDDDNEELDVLENELEENDPVKNYAGELYGEALLATCYTLLPRNFHVDNLVPDVLPFECPKINSISLSNDQQRDVVLYDPPIMSKKNFLPRRSSSKEKVSRQHLPRIVIPPFKRIVGEKRSSNVENNVINYQSPPVANLKGEISTELDRIEENSNSSAATIVDVFSSIAELKKSKDSSKNFSIDGFSSLELRKEVPAGKYYILRKAKINPNSLDKSSIDSAIYLYENRTSKGSSKTTVASSVILTTANENDLAEIDKLSSIASLNVVEEPLEELENEEAAFLAKPKLPRTPP